MMSTARSNMAGHQINRWELNTQLGGLVGGVFKRNRPTSFALPLGGGQVV